MTKLNTAIEFIIENFQCHKKTSLKPAPNGQLTVITGESRKGKTAILRALRWLFTNDPSGDEFINWDAKFARVTAIYASGHKVQRYRTRGGTNRYIITAPDGSEQVYEGFGNVVPLEVRQITGIRSIEFGDLKLYLNLHEQLEGPLMGNKTVSSPQRAKVLGKLAGTEEIDYAAKTLGTDLYRRRNDKKRFEAEKKEKAERLKEYEYLPALGKSIEKLKVKFAEIAILIQKRDKLQTLLEQLSNLNAKRDKIIGRLEGLKFIETVEPLLTKTSNDTRQYTELGQKTLKLTSVRRQINDAKAVLETTKGIIQAEMILTHLSGKPTTETRLRQLIDNLRANHAKQNTVTDILAKTEHVLLAETNINIAKDNHEKRQKLVMLGGRLLMTMNKIREVETTLLFTTAIPEVEMILVDLDGNLETRNKLQKLAIKLYDIKKKQLSVTAAYNRANEDVKRSQIEYMETLKELGRCPTCGSDIDESKVKEAV